MKSTTIVELSIKEINEAVVFWLKKERNIEIEGKVRFRVDGQDDPDDWRAEYPLTYVLVGAEATVKHAGA